MKLATLTLAAALAGLLGQAAAAEEFEVKMLNKGEKGMMVFEPDLVRAQVGDTVKFVVADSPRNDVHVKSYHMTTTFHDHWREAPEESWRWPRFSPAAGRRRC